MRRKLQLLSVAIVLLLVGCSKKENVSSGKTKIVKYEITSTSPKSSSITQTKTWYTDEQGNEGITYFGAGSSWQKTVVITSINKLTLRFRSDVIYLQNAGTVTEKIYVDGVVKASLATPSATYNGLPQVEPDEISCDF